MKTFFLLAFLFILDNLLVIFLPLRPIFGNYVVVPYMLLMGILMAVFFEENIRKIIAFALVFGLLFDIYNANLLGLFASLFTILAVVVKKYITPITPVNFVSIFYISMIAIFIVELTTFAFVFILGRTHFSLFDFLHYRLFTTLIFNFILLIFAYRPFFRILKKKPT